MEYPIALEANFPYENSLCRIPAGRLRPFRVVIEKLHLDNEHLAQKIFYVISQLEHKQLFFTNNECVEIIISELNENIKRLNEIYTQAEFRYRTKFKQ